jgi:hypothetical protein
MSGGDAYKCGEDAYGYDNRNTIKKDEYGVG